MPQFGLTGLHSFVGLVKKQARCWLATWSEACDPIVIIALSTTASDAGAICPAAM